MLPFLLLLGLGVVLMTRKSPEVAQAPSAPGAGAGESLPSAGGEGAPSAQESFAGSAAGDAALLAILGGLGAPASPAGAGAGESLPSAGGGGAPSTPKPVEWYVKDGEVLRATSYGRGAILANLADYRVEPIDARYIDNDHGVEYDATIFSKATKQDYRRLDEIVAAQQKAGLVLFVDKGAVDEFAALRKPNYVRLSVTKDPAEHLSMSWNKGGEVLVG